MDHATRPVTQTQKSWTKPSPLATVNIEITPNPRNSHEPVATARANRTNLARPPLPGGAGSPGCGHPSIGVRGWVTNEPLLTRSARTSWPVGDAGIAGPGPVPGS